MATPHIQAQMGDIAPLVLMPGDPLRAKYIAETFLDNVTQFNTVRNMYGYTGTYHGNKISVMGSGMGMPSIGIYAYELYRFFGVEKIIRIGSAGAYSPTLQLFDTLLVTEAWSESSYAKTQSQELRKVLKASALLNKELKSAAKKLSIHLHTGRVHSTDVFYRQGPEIHVAMFLKHRCLAAEMESFALFHTANILKKHAACLLTISDSLVTKEETTSEERQNAFTNMMKVALELA
ncbi:MAG: purine-nucleoside phosphorylase [Candidatus Izemoplasmatales bacterium]|nr:purine-nucleoside phosphorylase [Candidatus Izemoplasmatales bacterium]